MRRVSLPWTIATTIPTLRLAATKVAAMESSFWRFTAGCARRVDAPTRPTRPIAVKYFMPQSITSIAGVKTFVTTFSKQFLLLGVRELVLTGVGQFPAHCASGRVPRTRRARRGSKGERWRDHQHISQLEGRRLGEDGRYHEAAHGAPPRETGKRHLIKSATALGQREERGEYESGNKAEYTKDDRERVVRGEAAHHRQHEARTGPRDSPRETHCNCTANASQPLPHDRPRAWRGSSAKSFVLQSTGCSSPRARPMSRYRIATLVVRCFQATRLRSAASNTETVLRIHPVMPHL